MKNCPKCNKAWSEDFHCCPICGVDLVLIHEYSNVNMGNANAISGGVHSSDDHTKTDSDNETHINSHNTTNNTTIYEAKKSESERLKEDILTYRLKCQNLFKDGLISNDDDRQLRELQFTLSLSDELALPIKEEIRQQSKKRKKQLTLTGMSDIRQTKSIIEQNTAPALQRQLVKLESWMQEYDDNTLKLMYYQMSSILEPVRYTNRYEDGAKDEYWEVYWAHIAYLLQNREKQANEALANLGRWHAYYPEQNDIILLLAGRLMLNEPLNDIQQVRNKLSSHFSPDLQLLLDAMDELLNMDWAKEAICIRPAHSFYINSLFNSFVETQKTIGQQHLKEIREQEKQKREQEERNKQAELNLQNHIRSQKTLVLQKFQETGRIEKACLEAGVAFHTFNVWLEEDPILASSYNELVHCMEVQKYEELEQKRKQEELEIQTKKLKQSFKFLFEQNECDLLKTCTEIGISSATYYEWCRTDAVFNDEIAYIIRKNDEIVDQYNRQIRAKTIKKVGVIVGILITLVIIGFSIFAIIDNINEEKAAEKARIEQEKQKREQEERQMKEIKNQHQSLIDNFNHILNEIERTVKSQSYMPDAKEFENSLNSLENSLKAIHRFEQSNSSISDFKYDSLKQNCSGKCDELVDSLKGKYTNSANQGWSDMISNVKNLKNRL